MVRLLRPWFDAVSIELTSWLTIPDDFFEPGKQAEPKNNVKMSCSCDYLWNSESMRVIRAVLCILDP